MRTLPPVTDSPWFWGCMFLTAALLLLVWMEPRFNQRQAQLEQQYFARQQHGASVKPEGERAEPSQPGDTLITLRPLHIAGWIGLAAVWGLFLWSRRVAAEVAEPSEQPPIASERPE